jgi:hypothetical protein
MAAARPAPAACRGLRLPARLADVRGAPIASPEPVKLAHSGYLYQALAAAEARRQREAAQTGMRSPAWIATGRAFSGGASGQIQRAE